METTLDTIRDIKLYQPKRGYRFSLDALLLFSFVNLKRVSKIADLGAGSGVVGLLLSKRYPNSHVTLIELQEGLYKLAEKNISINGLEERVTAVKEDIRTLAKTVPSTHYDLIVSNPPFRKPLTGLISEEKERAVARHEINLKLHELLSAASSLLRHHGRFCLIHLPERLAELIERLRASDMEPKRMRFVHSKKSTEAKMVLVEAVKGARAGLEVEPPLFIYDERGSYTGELRKIFGQIPA